MFDITIVTDETLTDKNSDPRSAMVFSEDNSLAEGFRRRGLSCNRVAWDEKNFDWSSTKVALIRSTWNYSTKIGEFVEWLQKVDSQCNLINPKDLILWNIDKKYLFDLKDRGIKIPETHILNSQEEFIPGEWKERFKSKGLVIKPTISADAKNTWLIMEDTLDSYDKDKIYESIRNREMLVQPFLESVTTYGEVSLVFIEGEFIQGMLKKPKDRDFRVQENHGGSLLPYIPEDKEVEFGQKVLQICKKLKGEPCYARVDFCYSGEKKIELMELEVIEPQLWLPYCGEAVEKFVSGVKKRM